MDVFTWSIPFILEKIIEIMYYVIRPSDENEFDDDEDIELDEKDLKFL